MEAYVTQIKIYDDDNELIGTLDHSCDDLFTFTPKEGLAAFSDDYRFIAKVLDSQLCKELIKGD